MCATGGLKFQLRTTMEQPKKVSGMEQQERVLDIEQQRIV